MSFAIGGVSIKAQIDEEVKQTMQTLVQLYSKWIVTDRFEEHYLSWDAILSMAREFCSCEYVHCRPRGWYSRWK
jgi:hypothetical protein